MDGWNAVADAGVLTEGFIVNSHLNQIEQYLMVLVLNT